MSNAIVAGSVVGPKGRLSPYYSRIGVMTFAALALSAAVIVYFNHTMYNERTVEIYNSLELAAITLMPYMISAAVAAITAMGVITILPVIRSEQPARLIQLRIRMMGEGDLSVQSRVDVDNDYLEAISHELNCAIGALGNRVAQLKIINRQQWDLLESVRQATLRSDYRTATSLIEKMEQNWKRIARIEQQLRT